MDRKESDRFIMRPELPDYGTFPRWPAEGTAWIHPDDRAVVMRLIPSDRIFRRERFDGSYYHYRHGKQQFRLKPCMWLPLADEGVEIGDLVETVGTSMERELFVGTISEALYSSEEGRCIYRISRPGAMENERTFGREEFRVLTDKTKLRQGTTEHPLPHWVEEYRIDDGDENRLHLPSDVEADDRADQQTDGRDDR